MDLSNLTFDELLDAIRKTHSDFRIEPDIVKLLGTDQIFSSDFEAEEFIERENQKSAQWQALSKKWYLY